MGSTLFAVVNRAEVGQSRALGRYSKDILNLIAGIDPALHHSYERRAKSAAEEAWRSVEPLTRGRFKGTAQEAHDALDAAGKLTKVAYRAAVALIARDYIDREAYSILLAPFVALGSAVAA